MDFSTWIRQLLPLPLSLSDLKHLLRRYKYKEFLRITVRDLAETGPFEETLEELSSLAVVLIRVALREVIRVVLGTQWQVQWTFLVLGMGKLGGNKLTYHSDLDLIFLHSGTGCTSGPNEIEPQEYWIRITQRLISILTAVIRTDHACKLDNRLRPSGNAGCWSLPSRATCTTTSPRNRGSIGCSSSGHFQSVFNTQ
jgi:glutamate-ammonia-ligase adenylyltransferase